jgi:hypothetical protein
MCALSYKVSTLKSDRSLLRTSIKLTKNNRVVGKGNGDTDEPGQVVQSRFFIMGTWDFLVLYQLVFSVLHRGTLCRWQGVVKISKVHVVCRSLHTTWVLELRSL